MLRQFDCATAERADNCALARNVAPPSFLPSLLHQSSNILSRKVTALNMLQVKFGVSYEGKHRTEDFNPQMKCYVQGRGSYAVMLWGFKYQAAETRDGGDTVVAINCLAAERTRILAAL